MAQGCQAAYTYCEDRVVVYDHRASEIKETAFKKRPFVLRFETARVNASQDTFWRNFWVSQKGEVGIFLGKFSNLLVSQFVNFFRSERNVSSRRRRQ